MLIGRELFHGKW